MVTKTAARLLVLALSAQVLTAQGAHLPAEGEPVVVGSQIRAFGADAEHVRLVRWATTRFDAGGLEIPEADVYFHFETDWCAGDPGMARGGRIDVCIETVGEVARRVLLHEMGHTWIDDHVSDSVRERFLDLRGLHSWNGLDAAWQERGYEQGAEIIAWELGTRYVDPAIPDADPASMDAGFELLTGIGAPVDR